MIRTTRCATIRMLPRTANALLIETAWVAGVRVRYQGVAQLNSMTIKAARASSRQGRRRGIVRKSNGLESAGRDFYERIRKGYIKIAELKKTRVKIIDASQSVNDIKNEIWEFVSLKLNLE